VTESSPTVAPDGTIYVGVNQEVWAITPDGKQEWTAHNEGAIGAAMLVRADGSFCYANRWAQFVVFGPDKVCQAVVFLSGAYDSASAAIGPTGTLYASGQREAQFFALRAAVPLAQSSWPKFRANPRNTGNLRTPGRR